MNFKRFSLLALAFFSFVGCAPKGYLSNEPILVKFQAKNYKVEDYGFLGTDDKAAKLNVYHAGVLILQIETDTDTTCIDGKCLSSENFMKDFICANLPKNALLNILQAKPIDGLKKESNGFGYEQNEKSCNFKYSVEDRGIKAQTPNFLLSLQGIHDAD